MNLMKFLKWISISLFLCASGLSASPFVYVGSTDSPEVFVVDHASASIVATVAVPAEPTKVIANTDGSLVLVGDSSGQVDVVSTQTNNIVFSFSVPGVPSGLDFSADGTHFFVLTYGGTLTIFNATTYSIEQVIPDVGIDSQFAISPNGNQLCISNKVLGTVAVYVRDPASLQFVLTTTLTTELHSPYNVTFHPSGAVFYVLNTSNESVAVIDATTFAVVKVVCLSAKPLAAATSADGNFLYVATNGDDCSCSIGNVFFINTTTFSVSPAVKVGYSPYGLAVAKSAGGVLYATDHHGKSVYVIDPLSFSVSTVNIGHTSCGITVPNG